MCSFDVSSLFTNVPLDETIKICADALYDNLESQPCIPKEVFDRTTMDSATSTVELSFDNIIYRQIDGIAMGSPLGPALANIFVRYYEEKLFSEISKPAVYFRYVDDIFAIFRNERLRKICNPTPRSTFIAAIYFWEGEEQLPSFSGCPRWTHKDQLWNQHLPQTYVHWTIPTLGVLFADEA